MKQRKPQVNKARVSTNMMRARVILRGVLSRRISENRPLASRQPATAPLSITCRTPQAVKTVLSLVATLLLLIATRSPIFSGTFTDVTGSAGLHGAGFTFGNPIWGEISMAIYMPRDFWLTEFSSFVGLAKSLPFHPTPLKD